MEVSMLEESEWVRLPGLFRWDEICDVFASEATPDREWHFIVKLANEPDGPELLYVIHAAQDAAPEQGSEHG
jgi:hypothetical protein